VRHRGRRTARGAGRVGQKAVVTSLGPPTFYQFWRVRRLPISFCVTFPGKTGAGLTETDRKSKRRRELLWRTSASGGFLPNLSIRRSAPSTHNQTTGPDLPSRYGLASGIGRPRPSPRLWLRRGPGHSTRSTARLPRGLTPSTARLVRRAAPHIGGSSPRGIYQDASGTRFLRAGGV
jgi:hypothetical protein